MNAAHSRPVASLCSQLLSCLRLAHLGFGRTKWTSQIKLHCIEARVVALARTGNTSLYKYGSLPRLAALENNNSTESPQPLKGIQKGLEKPFAAAWSFVAKKAEILVFVAYLDILYINYI